MYITYNRYKKYNTIQENKNIENHTSESLQKLSKSPNP